MYSKLLALAASAYGMDVTANGVVCDGQGKVTLSYNYADTRTGVSLKEFECNGQALMNGDQALEGNVGDNTMEMTNMYAVSSQNTATDITQFNLADAVITATVQSESAGTTLSFETVTMTFSCTFDVEYTMSSAYDVSEKTEEYTFDTTFSVPASAFQLDMAASFSASSTASMTVSDATGAFDWNNLHDDVGFAPVKVMITQSGGEDFELISTMDGSDNCGATQLDVQLSNDGNRSYTISYMAFVMDQDGVQSYTATVTINMCVPTDVDGSACKMMQDGCF